MSGRARRRRRAHPPEAERRSTRNQTHGGRKAINEYRPCLFLRCLEAAWRGRADAFVMEASTNSLSLRRSLEDSAEIFLAELLRFAHVLEQALRSRLAMGWIEHLIHAVLPDHFGRHQMFKQGLHVNISMKPREARIPRRTRKKRNRNARGLERAPYRSQASINACIESIPSTLSRIVSPRPVIS